jgi:hypothetical protein
VAGVEGVCTRLTLPEPAFWCKNMVYKCV